MNWKLSMFSCIYEPFAPLWDMLLQVLCICFTQIIFSHWLFHLLQISIPCQMYESLMFFPFPWSLYSLLPLVYISFLSICKPIYLFLIAVCVFCVICENSWAKPSQGRFYPVLSSSCLMVSCLTSKSLIQFEWGFCRVWQRSRLALVQFSRHLACERLFSPHCCSWYLC